MINRINQGLLIYLLFASWNCWAVVQSSEIRIRDPFILPDKATQTYYMYAQMGNRAGSTGNGVEVYTSRDLESWEGPEPVFEVPDDFWAKRSVWAPEVHEYKGRYYLFVTLTSHDVMDSLSKSPIPPPQYLRGTQILVSESPAGPFEPFRNGPHTPDNWMSLDGTLFVEDGIPYMVFCHEWAQTHDGTVELVRLKEDLSGTVGTPKTLFLATEAQWVWNMQDSLPRARYDGFVTDGPWFYRTKSGKLQMIWSSFGEQRYAIGIAESESGKVAGPWKQVEKPLFPADGGHGMIFETFEGRQMLAFHSPNSNPDERLQLYEVGEDDDGLTLLPRKPSRDGAIHVPFSGDHADPSIVRDGEDFYLTYTSYGKVPGLKIWHSTNLLDWEPMGYALDQYVGSVWAPEFVKHADTFYIYFPTSAGKNFVVSASDPRGPWSEPVPIDVKAIDPGHIATPEGERFVYFNGGLFAPLADDGLSITGRVEKRYSGWPYPIEWDAECFCLESPKLTRRDGWYYLTSAQGGTAGPATSHMVVTARSRSPEGPWEDSPFNPVVHTWSPDEKFWSKGHGTLFPDASGDWWVIYHGYSRGELAWGRHVLLEAVEWTDDGWPRTVRESRVEGEVRYYANEKVRSDDFSSDSLDLQWQITGADVSTEFYDLSGEGVLLKGGGDRVRTLHVNPDEKAFEVVVELEPDGDTDFEVGLVVYYSAEMYSGVGIRDNRVRRLGLGMSYPEKGLADLNPRFLKIRVRNQAVSSWASDNGKDWQKLDRSYELSGYQHNVLGGFSWIRPAIVVKGNGAVRVHNFRFNPM